MPRGAINRTLLEKRLRARMQKEKLSLRSGAAEMGISATTLWRLLGKGDPNISPDLKSVALAAAWCGLEMADLAPPARKERLAIGELTAAIRKLPGLSPRDATALIGLTKMAYEALKGSGRVRA